MVDSIIENTGKIALLIDGDNAQPSLIEQMLSETGKYGQVTIRRIYGDWTTPQMKGWKNTSNNFAIQPIQQYRYTVGKNATDSALIIDAMDILHSGNVNGFCLVSSDSDYTRLATRIREKGIFVMGIGEQKTPKPFINACNVFIYTENLSSQGSISTTKKSSKTLTKLKPLKKSNPVPLIKKAFNTLVQDGEWVDFPQLGAFLRKLDPSFDPRSYGFLKLKDLINDNSDIFELKHESKGTTTVYYVKTKDED